MITTDHPKAETLDPRDPWARTRRIEIFRVCQENGITQFQDGPLGLPPKDLMIRELKKRGIKPPSVPPRGIGKYLNERSGDTTPDSHHYSGQQVKPTGAVTVEADEILERDWQQAQQQTQREAKSYNDMRAELKAAGVKLDRKWDKARVTEEWEKL